jgi:hypothetical protein
MGIRDWFDKKPGSVERVEAPSPEYPTPRAAIEAILRAHPGVGDNEDWITFEAEGAGKKAMIEVTGNQVNFCNVKVDLPRLLQEAGLGALAERVRPAGRKGTDLTLWTIENATVDELIEIVDFALTKAFGLGNSCRLDAVHQD